MKKIVANTLQKIAPKGIIMGVGECEFGEIYLVFHGGAVYGFETPAEVLEYFKAYKQAKAYWENQFPA